MQKSHLLYIPILCILVSWSPGQNLVSGRVFDNETGEGILGANVVSAETGTVTDEDGYFSLTVAEGTELSISHIGYKMVTLSAVGTGLYIGLERKILRGEEVIVSATRAVKGITPVAFSTLTPEEIKTRYTVEDVPMILSMEPGVYAYSESGNGTGYSYISIRGFDQSRIAVMMDNVPLNDNESHQVYWVDHGDVLSDAQDIQIQRGVGNSLYGSSAFGGSINVTTKIASEVPLLSASFGSGSFNTNAWRLKANSGTIFGQSLSVAARISQIRSDGYRDEHGSEQRALFTGIEQRDGRLRNQFRAMIGYENTQLVWDGIYASDINDRSKRRAGYRAYTDDFLQQIYSLNTNYRVGNGLQINNVTYLVQGKGYYEVFKTGEDYYSYNLDMMDQYSDEAEQNLFTDLLRRKWIANTYYGVIPTFTKEASRYRLDLGAEIRAYRGDHYGEVTDVSDSSLAVLLGPSWYEYYRYRGTKLSKTLFLHVAYDITHEIRLVGDLQYQTHDWELDQQEIGHAAGHQIGAQWKFLNPRFGAVYSLSDVVSLFVHYGKAQKEPADNQIIEADDVWSEPVKAAAEVIHNVELGANWSGENASASLNAYRIDYENEQLKNIDIEQEGEYAYFSAHATVHEGVEFDYQQEFNDFLSFGLNGAFNRNTFISGPDKERILPNIPMVLLNGSLRYRQGTQRVFFANGRYVGKQYLDAANIGSIDPCFILDLGIVLTWENLELSLNVKNALDTLYSTYGYGYEWEGYQAYYWPGATRNYYLALTVGL